MRSNQLSLRQHLLLWVLPPIMVLIGLWIWGTYIIVLHFAHLAYDRALEDTVHTLADQVHINQNNIKIDLPPDAREMLEYDKIDKVYFSVSDNHNYQWAGNHTLLANAFLNNKIGQSRNKIGQVKIYDSHIDNKPVRIAEFKMPIGQSNHIIYVRVAETLHKREIMAQEALKAMIAPQLIFLMSMAFLIWYGIGRGIAPLQRIRDAISMRTHQDLSPLDETGLPFEVHEQVHVINDLMSRLSKTIHAQQRFIADATHQLRTPITVLRTQTELALRADNFTDLNTIVKKLDSTTIRLTRIANQLLNLSRAENGLFQSLKISTLQVSKIVEDVVASLVPTALSKDIDIRIEIAENLPALEADEQFLSEMLANLVDNAIRYNMPKGKIIIQAYEDSGYVLLKIIDNGPGIPDSELKKVLERFYRGANASSEGSGLGLAIAQEIAALHNGQITLEAGCGNSGLEVTVKLPSRQKPLVSHIL